MKRLILLATILFVVSSSYGANKMSMVTYFPVPYVAYSQVSADQQLDVGLTSTCTMNLGCSESNVNLKAHTVNLQKGKLELNNGKGVFGQNISLGSGSGAGQVRFNNVRMKGGEMQSLNADGMNVQALELFGKQFPACKGKGGSDGQMKWQELALQGYSGTNPNGELYLVCGEPALSICQPTDSRGATYTEECPDGQTGTITYTWDYTDCQYNKTGSCSQKQKYQCIVDYSFNSVAFDFFNSKNFFQACGFDAGTNTNYDSFAPKMLYGMRCGDKYYRGPGNEIELTFLPESGAVVNEYYVYKDKMYTCRCPNDHPWGPPPKDWRIGYFCVKWGEVEDKNLCKTPKFTQWLFCN